MDALLSSLLGVGRSGIDESDAQTPTAGAVEVESLQPSPESCLLQCVGVGVNSATARLRLGLQYLLVRCEHSKDGLELSHGVKYWLAQVRKPRGRHRNRRTVMR